jgi:hypothetical protein
MSSRRIASWCVGIVGALLSFVGLAHNWFGLPSLQRAVARGELASRIAEPQLINWAFSGGAISVLGLVCLLHLGELRRGRRAAWRVNLLIGGFFVLVGVGGYLRTGSPGILVFAGLGSLIVVPLLLSARDFTGQ